MCVRTELLRKMSNLEYGVPALLREDFKRNDKEYLALKEKLLNLNN